MDPLEARHDTPEGLQRSLAVDVHEGDGARVVEPPHEPTELGRIGVSQDHIGDAGLLDASRRCRASAGGAGRRIDQAQARRSGTDQLGGGRGVPR